MKQYTGWMEFKNRMKEEAGVTNASEIASACGVSTYTLDSLFNNRAPDVPKNKRGKIDRWIKKVTNGKLKLSDFTVDVKEALGNITEEEVKDAQHKQAVEDEQKNRFNVSTKMPHDFDVVSFASALSQYPSAGEEDLSKKYDYDVPSLIRKEEIRKEKLEMDRHDEVDGWKEESLDEFFASLDRYRSGLGKLAKKEIDRIQMLVLSSFDLAGRPDGQHYARQLEYVYIMGIERGWQEAQEDHAEVLRHLLQETYKGAK